jgi:hypothetical protein
MDPITLSLLIGGGASLVGGIANGIGSWFGADAQRDAANQAMGVQRDIWGQQQRNQAPYLQAGQSTLADLLQQMRGGGFDVNPAEIANDPGYQFRLAEGQKALERSAAARGGLNSGGTLKSLTRYSQGVASDELQNAWLRKQGAFNRMMGVAGMGQGAANSLGAMGGQYANNMGELYGALGNAESARWTGLGNAISGGASQLGGMGMNLAGMGGGSGGFGAARLPMQSGSAVASPRQNPNTLSYLTYGGK